MCVFGWGLSESECQCVLMSCLYISVFIANKCASFQPENRHLLQQTHVTRDRNTVGEKKHHVLFMYFTVTNHSDDSHHWEILWYTVCNTGIYMYLYTPKGDLLCSFSDSYLYFWLLLEHVCVLKWSEKLYFTHTVCAGTSEVTLCLNRIILTPVNFSPPPKKAQSALYLHPWHLCQAHRNRFRR